MRDDLARIANDLTRLLRAEADGPAGGGILVPRAAPRVVPRDVLMERIAEGVRSCTRCALCRSRNRAVPGEGDPESPLLLIGEAPGADEDREGRPFVGRAGDLLTKMLRAINVEREKAFIANVLKCRPPENRDPAPDEVAECRRWLEAQIALIRPRVLVTLGRISTRLVLETTRGITFLRGTTHRYRYEGGEAVVVPMFHPSYLLRDETKKPLAWEDMKTVHRLLREATGDWPPPIDTGKVSRMSREKRRR